MRSSSVSALALGLLLGAAGCGGATTPQEHPKTPAQTPASAEVVESAPSADNGPLDEDPPPGKDGVALSLAVNLVDEGEFSKAIRMMKDLHKRYPNNGVVLYELGLAYRLAHRPEDAVKLWTPYRSRLEVMALAGLASALDEAGHPQESITMLREELQRHPRSGLLHSELGTTLVNLGKPEEALPIYEKATQVEPSFAPSYMHLAELFATTPSRGLTLIHGETFRLLEPKTARSQKIGALMMKVCEQALQATTPNPVTGAKVALAPTPSITKMADADKVPVVNQLDIAFGPGLVTAAKSGLNLAAMHRARRSFLDRMKTPTAPKGLGATPLVKWLQALDTAGHLEAYDYWLYGPADRDAMDEWFASHRPQFESMAVYLANHPLYPAEPQPLDTPENVTASLVVPTHEFRL